MAIELRCELCGAANPVGSRFCASCGAGVEIACPACAHRAPAGSEFCPWCGTMLRQARREGSAGGERKQATVLFADIVDSTSFIAGLDAEEAMGRLRPVVAAMAQAVRRFDGTILRSLGDGLKAAFGAPQAREGHALLACKAALAMQEAVSALPASPPIRVGLHSGEVIAGELDTGTAVEHEAAGITVHVANRIEQLARPGEICLSSECRQLVLAYCDTASLGRHVARGLPDPIELHRLVGLKPAVASGQFRGADLARLYGREEELAVLQGAFAAAEQGEAGAIGLVAPPGLGKSRLCYELGEWCRRRGVDVLEARALVYAHATPLQFVLEMLRSLFRLSALHEPTAARDAIAMRLTEFGLLAEEELPLLADFLGLGTPEPSVARLDPRVKHARLRDLVRRMVQGRGREPGVIIVEDAHWLDQPSEDFVETLVDAVAGTRVLLVINFRPPYRAVWMERPHYREVVLGELGAEHAGDLVLELVGDAPALAGLRAEIAERSGGNPFFAEELVLSLADNGVLVGERGQYRPGASRNRTQLPATLETVLGARIDRLPEREKMLLQVGAVVGKEFPLAVVQTVAAVPEAEMEPLLARLRDSGLVREQATVAGRGFAFRHPLIQEVAYAMQLRARRTALHAAVAEAIGTFEWGRLDETAGLLAHHCEAAGDLMQAATHLSRAAQWLGRSNSREALRTWKRVRGLLEDVPSSETNERMRALSSGMTLNFGWREGMSADEAKPYADEALHYAKAGIGAIHTPLLLGAYGRILAATGSADDYAAAVREALSITEQDDFAARTIMHGTLSQACYLGGLLREALAANDAALATIAEQQGLNPHLTRGLTANELLGFDLEHWIRCYRTMILARLGRVEEAATWVARVMQTDLDRVDVVVQFIPHMAQVEMAWSRGDAQTTETHARFIADYATRGKSPYVRSYGIVASALARSAASDFAGAADILGRGLLVTRQAHAGRELEARMLAELADAQLGAEEIEAAAATAAEAIDVARRRTHRISEAHASIVRARALLRTKKLDGKPVADLLARAKQLIDISGTRALDELLTTAQNEVETSRQ